MITSFRGRQTNRCTRKQALEILNAPRGASMVELSKRLKVRLTLVKHIRYRCKWMKEVRR